MPRFLAFVIFITIVLSVAAAMHLYVWLRLVRDLNLPPVWHRVLSGVLALLFLSIPATFYASRVLPPDRGALALSIFYGWIGVLFLLVMLCTVADVAKLVVRLGRWSFSSADTAVDPERRAALARLAAGAIAIVAGGATTAGTVSALGTLVVREVRVGLRRLPASLSGTTIVQLSDLHIGPTLRREFALEVADRVNRLDADLIVITGDLVDGSVEQLRHLVEPLADLRAKHGVYFVTGNHEYYSGAVEWCEELQRLGWRVLRNERVSIGAEGASFDLAGVDDHKAHHFGHGHGADLPSALAGRDESREVVLLAHQPVAVHEARERGVGLVLSGHTHGGQIFPFNWFVRLQQPVVRGLHRFGDTLIYVSCGTGYWGPPLRLGAPAEITRIVLEPSPINSGTDRD